MKGSIVLFNRGSGGNFLARVLTLDPGTVPLGKAWPTTVQERCDYYCYNESPNAVFSQHTKDGLSYWVEKELRQMYFPFSRGIENLVDLNSVVVEFIHPDHYYQKLELLGPDDQFDLYYIDITGCESWVVDQVRHKIYLSLNADVGASQRWETQQLNQIINAHSAQPISLANILNSELTFLEEYAKISKSMGLGIYPEQALQIYKSWKTTWKNPEINPSL